MSPADFWCLIPKELHYIIEAWAKTREEDFQSTWEQTRMIVYYQFCSWPKKTRNPSYQKFKAQHLPFPWDKINKNVEDDLETMGELPEQPVNPDQWLDRISKMNGESKPVDLKQLEGTLDK